MFRNKIIAFKESYFEYSLYFLIFSLFFGNALLSIASVFFYLSLFFTNYRKENFQNKELLKPILIFCLYFLVNVLILIFLMDDINDLSTISKYISFVLVPLIFCFNYKSLSKSNTILNIYKVLIFSALISFLLSFFNGLWKMFFYEDNINSIYISYNFLTDLFGVHQTYLSFFYVLALIFCIDIYSRKNTASKYLYIIIGTILFVAVILLSSRTAILAAFLVITIKIIITNKKRFKKVVIILVSTILLGSILTISIPTLKQRFININQNISSYSGTSFRIKIWNNAIEVIEKSPIYGYGVKISQETLKEQYYNTNFRRAYLGNYNVHNQYIQSCLDSGVFGLLALLLMILSPLLYFRNKLNLLLFTLIILIALITESFLIRQNGILFYCLFYFILAYEDLNSAKNI